MKNFSVYFEIYGHKIKAENVYAETESEAQMKLLRMDRYKT